MKSVITLVTISLLAFVNAPVLAQSGHTGHASHASHESGQSVGKMAEGTVKKVDKTAGKITIAHGPIDNLRMPGMTMVFAVKEKALLDKVKPGDKIRFEAIDAGGTLTVSMLEIAK